MVYWQEDTGVAMAGKHKSDICSGMRRVRKLHRRRDKSVEQLQRLEEPREVLEGALTLFGPVPPKAKEDEGPND